MLETEAGRRHAAQQARRDRRRGVVPERPRRERRYGDDPVERTPEEIVRDVYRRAQESAAREEAARTAAADERTTTNPALIAWHESGHAVVAAALNCELSAMRLTPQACGEQGATGVFTTALGGGEYAAFTNAVIDVAGLLGARRCPDWTDADEYGTGHFEDFRTALEFVGGDEELLERAQEAAAGILDEHLVELRHLARTLLERRALTGEEAHEVIEMAAGIEHAEQWANAHTSRDVGERIEYREMDPGIWKPGMARAEYYRALQAAGRDEVRFTSSFVLG